MGVMFFRMNASTSVHTGSAGQHKSKQQNMQGNQENAGSQGVLVAVLAQYKRVWQSKQMI